MTNLDYVSKDWPQRFFLPFRVPSFNNTTDPVYPLGSATVTWKPPAGHLFFLRRVWHGGSLSAVGTGIVVQATVYKGSVNAANIALNCVTASTDDPGDVNAESATPSNTSTGKDLITPDEGFLIRVQFSAGDTGTYDGGVVIVEGDMQ